MDAHRQSQKPHPQPAEQQDELPLTQFREGRVLDDPVDDASDDSFPASDPPAWSRTTTSSDSPRDLDGHDEDSQGQ